MDSVFRSSSIQNNSGTTETKDIQVGIRLGIIRWDIRNMAYFKAVSGYGGSRGGPVQAREGGGGNPVPVPMRVVYQYHMSCGWATYRGRNMVFI